MKLSNLTELANKYNCDKGTQYGDKHGYTIVYESLFKPLKYKSIIFLELGLCIGGAEYGDNFINRIPDDMPSIKMWTEYFEKAHIYGFDLNDFSHLESNFKNFKFIQGDLSLKKDIYNLITTTEKLENKENLLIYDVILDDASHASFHQQYAFSILFPYLKNDGIYIIEDLNWQSPNYEKKFPNLPKTFDILMELKNIKNGLNSSLLNNYQFKDSFMELINDIKSIDFFNSNKLAIIRKV